MKLKAKVECMNDVMRVAVEENITQTRETDMLIQ
jgi:hypothetical protein